MSVEALDLNYRSFSVCASLRASDLAESLSPDRLSCRTFETL